MIINNEYLEEKSKNVGWVETYKYDKLLEGVQERILSLVLCNTDFISSFFENHSEVITPFKEDYFLTNMVFDWLRYEDSYYREKDRVERYWSGRLSVAGSGYSSGGRDHYHFDIHKEREDEFMHVVDLLVYVVEELDKDTFWKKLPAPVKMYYYFYFVASTFDRDAYHKSRGCNWIKSDVRVESSDNSGEYRIKSVGRMRIQEIDKDSMLKTFYRNSRYNKDPLCYANNALKEQYLNKNIYDDLYIPLFSEIYGHLTENYSLQGLVLKVNSSQSVRVFDTDSYRKEMAEVETRILDNRFAAEQPIKDAEQYNRIKGRNKQSRVENVNRINNLLILGWVGVFLSCLIYPFI